MKTNSECIEIIKGRLTEQRFIHSLNVADCAKELAIKFGADPEKAYTAGLIHDSCKNLETNAQLQYLLENKVECLSHHHLMINLLIIGTLLIHLLINQKEVMETVY
jgi:HD superfamily phosphohydrolase YqeK